MLTLQTLNNIEALLMSRSDPRWGEFIVLAQTLQEVQAMKKELTNRLQPQTMQVPTMLDGIASNQA